MNDKKIRKRNEETGIIKFTFALRVEWNCSFQWRIKQ